MKKLPTTGCKTACMLFVWMFLSASWLMAQQPLSVIEGTIKDENGDPLTGAVVKVVNAPARGTVSDVDGRYSIRADAGETLRFSYVGYEAKDVKVANSKRIDVVFDPSKQRELQEIVVIGYGQVKKQDLTGSVVNVKMDDIKDIPVLSIDNALQGRVSGMDVMSTTGEPGASTSIRIRGTRSITADNEPLIVVDGVMDAVQSIADINAADIADITILKDASSTAIYGSRGANGVIIITTKRGENVSKPTIRFKSDVGFAQIPRYLDIMNATEFAQYYNDYAYNSPNYRTDITPTSPMSAYPFPDPYIYGEGTNWTKEITRIAPYQDHSLSVSGGNNNTTYYASAGYNNTQGIIKNSGVERYTLRFKIDYDLFKNVKIGYSRSYTNKDQDINLAVIGGQQPWNAAIYLSPFLGVGDSYNAIYGNGQVINNPMHYIQLGTNNEVGISSADVGYIQIQAFRNMEIRSQLSYSAYNSHGYRYESGQMPTKSMEEGGTAYRREYEISTLLSETTATYKFQKGNRHFFDALVGITGSNWQYTNFTLQGKGYLIDENTWNNMNAIADKENYTASSTYENKVKMSLLSR
ncbi:MAG: SusC/RagA family TonB-linked outer membrane protein, partial [Dysgonamonadaceae bacterium]|nr:SusC/RagA family TonB-linked outer membrane protein [Dysgonamonadaceae bacterium]